MRAGATITTPFFICTVTSLKSLVSNHHKWSWLILARKNKNKIKLEVDNLRTLNKSANPNYMCLPSSNSCPLLINLVWSMSLHFEFGTIQTATKDLWQFFAMLYLLFTIKPQRKFLKIQWWKAGHSNYMKFLHDTFLRSKSYSSSKSLYDNCSLSTV